MFLSSNSSSAKADVSRRFTKTIEKLVAAGSNAAEALANKTQLKQHEIDKNGWDGDVFNLDDMSKPWDRKELGDMVVASIKDAASPGVAGDIIVSTLQGDWLSAQERAFRLRHTTKPRANLHAASRRRGHGHPGGLFAKGLVNYVKNIVKLSKDKR